MHANLHQGNVSPAATSNSASCSITQRWCPFEEVHQRGEEGGREGGGGGGQKIKYAGQNQKAALNLFCYAKKCKASTKTR